MAGMVSRQCGMRNAECGMRNAECGVRNVECGIERRGRSHTDPPLAFRIPHSAFETTARSSSPTVTSNPGAAAHARVTDEIPRVVAQLREKTGAAPTTTVSDGGEIVIDATRVCGPSQLYARLLLACHTYARYVDPYDCSGDRVESDRRGAHRGPACPPRGADRARPGERRSGGGRDPDAAGARRAAHRDRRGDGSRGGHSRAAGGAARRGPRPPAGAG